MTMNPHPHETVVSETKARQGRSGRQVLTVLAVSLILALGAGVIAFMTAGPDDEGNAMALPPATTMSGAADS